MTETAPTAPRAQHAEFEDRTRDELARIIGAAVYGDPDNRSRATEAADAVLAHLAARAAVATVSCVHGDGSEHPATPDADGTYMLFDAGDWPVSLSVVLDRLREIADELDEVLTEAHELRRTGWFPALSMAVMLDRIAAAWSHTIYAHGHAQRLAESDPARAVREP